jgi:hypothetical protein
LDIRASGSVAALMTTAMDEVQWRRQAAMATMSRRWRSRWRYGGDEGRACHHPQEATLAIAAHLCRNTRYDWEEYVYGYVQGDTVECCTVLYLTDTIRFNPKP